MKRKNEIFSLVFLFFSTVVLYAGDVPTVGFRNLSATGIDQPGLITLDNLIFDFLKEQRTINAVDLRGTPGEPEPVVQTDYICTGSISLENSRYYLTLVMYVMPDNVKTAVITRNYDSYNRILLESRTVLKELIEAMNRTSTLTAAPSEQVNFIPVTNLDALSGSWRGEEGIEKVVILRGGKAVVFFSTGISMQLELSLSDGKLIARQKGPNQVKYFVFLPAVVATKVAASAPPASWELSLTEDKQSLIGVHNTVEVSHNGTDVISVKEVSPQVKWDRE